MVWCALKATAGAGFSVSAPLTPHRLYHPELTPRTSRSLRAVTPYTSFIYYYY